MERELFDWEAWDDLDTFAGQFYRCTMKVVIGPYAVGAHVATIVLDFGAGILTFYSHDGNVEYKCKVALHFAGEILDEAKE